MNFGAIEMPHLNNYSLDSLDFPRGILVILPGLVFFLGSTEQYKAMKIGIAFFGSKMDLWCISKVLSIFWTFSKLGLEKGAPGDTWRACRVPGRSLGAGLSGRGHSESSGRGSRGTAYSESSREGLSGLGHAGHVAGSGASGEFSRLGTREHVSYSQGFRMWFTG